MNIYLAAAFERKLELRTYAAEAIRLGHNITSRWIYGDEVEGTTSLAFSARQKQGFAQRDLIDINLSGRFVLWTEAAPMPRGGRHFEAGYAYAQGITICLIGGPENLFHYLIPTACIFPHWDDFVRSTLHASA